MTWTSQSLASIRQLTGDTGRTELKKTKTKNIQNRESLYILLVHFWINLDHWWIDGWMDHFSQPIEKFTKRVKSARSVYILCVFCQLAMTAYNILSVGVLLARESLDTKSLLGLIERRWWRKTQTSQGKWEEKRRMMMLLARLLMMWVWAVGRPELLSFFFSCTPFLMINFTKHFCSLKKTLPS